MFEIKGRDVIFNNLAVYGAPGPIHSHELYLDDVIIQYSLSEEDYLKASFRVAKCNILRISADGDTVWRIEHRKSTAVPTSEYQEIVKKGEEFWAYDGAYECKFDPYNGKILDYVFTK